MKIKIDKITPGMVLETSVYLPNSANPLIPIRDGEEHKLTEKEIAILKKKGLTEIDIQLAVTHNTCLNPHTEDVALSILGDKKIEQYITVATLISREILAAKDFSYDIASYSIQNKNEVSHALNTAIFTVEFLKNLSDELNINIDYTNGAMAALLHDIGIDARFLDVRKFKNIEFNTSNFPDADLSCFDKFKKEAVPIYSWALLNSNNRVSSLSKLAILLQDENKRKTGPLHYNIENDVMKKNGVYVLANAIHICSYLDDLLYELPVTKVEAKIKEDIEAGKIDKVFGKLLIKYIPLYPTGTKIMLSNGITASVMRQNSNKVNRPLIRCDMGDVNVIDLSCNDSLQIVGVMVETEYVSQKLK